MVGVNRRAGAVAGLIALAVVCVAPEPAGARSSGGGAYGPAAALAGAAAAPADSEVSARADVNGDGVADLVVASAARLQQGVAQPPDMGGSVYVIPGGAQLPAAQVGLINQDTPGVSGTSETDDNFGFSLATGDFNNDGRADVAIGSPYEDIGSTLDAGRVVVLYGTSLWPYLEGRGLNDIHQDVSGIPGEVEAYDRVGTALASGDFDGDGFADLAIGVPYEDIGSTTNAGGMLVLYGGSGGLVASGSQAFNAGTAGVVGDPESGDHWGWSLASGDVNGDKIDDLAVTVDGEQVEGVADPARGDAILLKGSASGLTGSGSSHVNVASTGTTDRLRTVAVGDFTGDGHADLVVYADRLRGAPANSGALVELRGGTDGISPTRVRAFNQDTPGVSGGDAAEDGDFFGAALSVGDLNGDGVADLVVGDQGENSGRGAASVFFGGAQGLLTSPDFFFSEAHPAITDTQIDDEHFGAGTRILDVDGDGTAEVVVAAPREDGAFADGALFVLDVTRSGATTTITGARKLTRAALNPGSCPADPAASCFGPGFPIAGGVTGPFEGPAGPGVASAALSNP